VNREGNYNIYYNRSPDNGVNWGDKIRLSNDAGPLGGASIAVEGEVVHVVWVDQRDGSCEIYYNRSTDNGVNWENEIRLSTLDNVHSSKPSIAVQGDVVHVAWIGIDIQDGKYRIYYRKSEDGGDNWRSIEKIRETEKTCFFPSITTCSCSDKNNADVHIVWTENTKVHELDRIYYRRHLCKPTGIEEEMKVGVERICSHIGGEILVFIPEKGEVNVEMYDIMGRKVGKRSFNHPGGEYRFKWKGEHSGVYFFKFKIKGIPTYKGGEVIKKVVLF
jgi:hypothetical protein